MWGNIPLFAALYFSTIAVNLSSLQAIKVTSSLTFKVVGQLKQVVVMLFASIQGERITTLQFVGFMVSSFGFYRYVKYKSEVQAFKEHKSQSMELKS